MVPADRPGPYFFLTISSTIMAKQNKSTKFGPLQSKNKLQSLRQ
jgi:hypothetical protein